MASLTPQQMRKVYDTVTSFCCFAGMHPFEFIDKHVKGCLDSDSENLYYELDIIKLAIYYRRHELPFQIPHPEKSHPGPIRD